MCLLDKMISHHTYKRAIAENITTTLPNTACAPMFFKTCYCFIRIWIYKLGLTWCTLKRGALSSQLPKLHLLKEVTSQFLKYSCEVSQFASTILANCLFPWNSLIQCNSLQSLSYHHAVSEQFQGMLWWMYSLFS